MVFSVLYYFKNISYKIGCCIFVIKVLKCQRCVLLFLKILRFQKLEDILNKVYFGVMYFFYVKLILEIYSFLIKGYQLSCCNFLLFNEGYCELFLRYQQFFRYLVFFLLDMILLLLNIMCFLVFDYLVLIIIFDLLYLLCVDLYFVLFVDRLDDLNFFL